LISQEIEKRFSKTIVHAGHSVVSAADLLWLMQTAEQLDVVKAQLEQEKETKKNLVTEIRNLKAKTRFKVYEENLRLIDQLGAARRELDLLASINYFEFATKEKGEKIHV
jgi:hypothetical protein